MKQLTLVTIKEHEEMSDCFPGVTYLLSKTKETKKAKKAKKQKNYRPITCFPTT